MILALLICAYVGKRIYHHLSTRTVSIKGSDVESTVDTNNIDQDKYTTGLAYESIEELTHSDGHVVLASMYDTVQDAEANIQVHKRQEENVHMREMILTEHAHADISKGENTCRECTLCGKAMSDQPDDLYITVIP